MTDYVRAFAEFLTAPEETRKSLHTGLLGKRNLWAPA